MKVLEKSTPSRQIDGKGATPRLACRSNKLTATSRIHQLSPGGKRFYRYTGDHPLGFELFDHPLRGFVRFVEGRPVGLSTDEWDALEAYAEQEAEARFQDEQDAIAKERVYGVMS